MPSRTKTDRLLSSPPEFGIVERGLEASTSVIAVQGDLDLATAPRLKRTLLNLLQTGSSRLVIDLSHTTFVDSTALSVLVGVTRRLDPDAGLAIVCAQPSVLKIFELAGLDGAFAIFPTLDEALAHLRGDAAWAS